MLQKDQRWRRRMAAKGTAIIGNGILVLLQKKREWKL